MFLSSLLRPGFRDQICRHTSLLVAACLLISFWPAHTGAQSYEKDLSAGGKVLLTIKNRYGRVSVIASKSEKEKSTLQATSAGAAVAPGDVNISGGEITVGSDRFPPFVLEEHVRVGKAITGRTRTQLYQPVGVFEGFDSNYNLVGWACDPDSAWGEKVRVDFYEVGGGLLNATMADQSSEFFPQCRSGMAHRFSTFTWVGLLGKKVIAVARDLDSGTAQLSSTCLDAPACALYMNDYAPIGEFRISPTGFADGWTCDPDAPLASLKVEVWMDSTAPNGTRVSTALANLASDETINGQCGGGTAHRFGVQLPSWTKGHAIYVYGIDTMQGSSFLLAASNSGCPGVGVCIW